MIKLLKKWYRMSFQGEISPRHTELCRLEANAREKHLTSSHFAREKQEIALEQLCR